MMDHPELGYEPNFLEQLAWNNGEAARLIAERKIKVVHDGGALNPRGLAVKVQEYLYFLGITCLKIAWVSGDDVTSRIRQSNLSYNHLDIEGLSMAGNNENILAANAYTGQQGIIAALEAGADIVICGRCCDASPVMALASWWHDWKPTDYDKIAGSLMAGHVIECGAYTTGGNYCGFQEIARPYRMGYPIAEIFADGSSVITKPDHSNGAVTVDTVKAQFLYEIQGPFYLNPDVIARIDNGSIEQIAPNRIRVSGITGQPPPPTTKLAMSLLGGYQAEISAYAVGLDVDAKLANYKANLLRELDESEFSTISIKQYGTPPRDPKSQAECTVQFRLFVQAPKKEAIEKFRKALFFNGQQGYCGLHLSMDWRTLAPKPFIRYFPGLISQESLDLSVHFVGSKQMIEVSRANNAYGAPFKGQESYDPKGAADLSSFGPTVARPLGMRQLRIPIPILLLTTIKVT
jgi:hypothetical protein